MKTRRGFLNSQHVSRGTTRALMGSIRIVTEIGQLETKNNKASSKLASWPFIPPARTSNPEARTFKLRRCTFDLQRRTFELRRRTFELGRCPFELQRRTF